MRPERHGHLTISTRQLMIMLVAARLVAGICMPLVSTGAGRDSWIAVLASGLVMCVLGIAVGVWIRPFGRDSFAEYARRATGTIPGALAGLLMAAAALGLVYVKARLLGNLIQIVALPFTPQWAIALPALVAGGYLAWRGLDGIGRAAEAIITVMGLTISLTFLAGATARFELEHILPVMEYGIAPVLAGTAESLSWYLMAVLIVLAAYPHLDRREGTGAAIAWSSIVSATILAVFIILAAIAFGPEEVKTLTSPFYSLLKNVQLGSTIRRMEIVILFVWVPGYMLNLAIYLWVGARLVSGALGFQIRHAALALALALAIAVVAVRQDQLGEIRLTIGTAPLIMALSVAALLLVVGVVARLRRGAKGKKRNRTRGTRQSSG